MKGIIMKEQDIDLIFAIGEHGDNNHPPVVMIELVLWTAAGGAVVDVPDTLWVCLAFLWWVFVTRLLPRSLSLWARDRVFWGYRPTSVRTYRGVELGREFTCPDSLVYCTRGQGLG